MEVEALFIDDYSQYLGAKPERLFYPHIFSCVRTMLEIRQHVTEYEVQESYPVILWYARGLRSGLHVLRCHCAHGVDPGREGDLKRFLSAWQVRHLIDSGIRDFWGWVIGNHACNDCEPDAYLVIQKLTLST